MIFGEVIRLEFTFGQKKFQLFLSNLKSTLDTGIYFFTYNISFFTGIYF